MQMHLPVEDADELRAVLRAVVENDGGVRYLHEDDEVGERACCRVTEYKPHEPTCFVPRAAAMLQKIALATPLATSPDVYAEAAKTIFRVQDGGGA